MKQPHILILLALLVMGGMIVSPVSAYNYTITAEPLGGTFVDIPGDVYNASVDLSPEGMAAQRIVVDIPTGTSVNFTLWYGSGTSVSGWMQYNPSDDCTGWFSWYEDFCQYSGVSIGTDEQGYNYRGIQEIGRIDIVGYARDDTDESNPVPGIIVYDSVAGLSDRRVMAFHPVTNTADLVIYKFQISSDSPVGIAYYKNTRENVLKAATLTPTEAIKDWINWIGGFIGFIKNFLLSVWWIINFFFIENLLLVIALWISVTMAYSALSSRNIFMFYKKFFGYQRALFDFIMSIWDYFVKIASALIPWK